MSDEIPTSTRENYQRILEASAEIVRQLKKKKFYLDFDIRGCADFETTEVDLGGLQIGEKVEKETIFSLHSLAEGRKYKSTLVACTPSTFLCISSKVFYETFALFLKKRKAERIRAFRKFECFSMVGAGLS